MIKKKTLIIDNYDSFTYNIYQYVGELKGNPTVIRNDQISIKEIKENKYSHIIISPGPGNPKNKDDFNVCKDVILKLQKQIPILGVCLGLQGICYYLGGEIIQAPEIMHGKTSIIKHNKKSPLFQKVPENFEVMRYHSLIAKKENLPDLLKITSQTKDGIIMSLENQDLKLYGVQFHPESIGTKWGKQILKNFLNIN